MHCMYTYCVRMWSCFAHVYGVLYRYTIWWSCDHHNAVIVVHSLQCSIHACSDGFRFRVINLHAETVIDGKNTSEMLLKLPCQSLVSQGQVCPHRVSVFRTVQLGACMAWAKGWSLGHTQWLWTTLDYEKSDFRSSVKGREAERSRKNEKQLPQSSTHYSMCVTMLEQWQFEQTWGCDQDLQEAQSLQKRDRQWRQVTSKNAEEQ